MTDRRRTFAPVVAAGLGGAVLGAVGSSRVIWSVESRGAYSNPTLLVDEGQLPLATTLSMVVLAAWGVVLVTRGRWRLAAAVVGALASLGVLATVVAGWWLVPGSLRESLGDLGSTQVGIEVSAWYWLTLVGALLAAAGAVAALLLARSWPEMGTRYDTPTGPPARAPDEVDDESLQLWKALDRGDDPTA